MWTKKLIESFEKDIESTKKYIDKTAEEAKEDLISNSSSWNLSKLATKEIEMRKELFHFENQLNQIVDRIYAISSNIHYEEDYSKKKIESFFKELHESHELAINLLNRCKIKFKELEKLEKKRGSRIKNIKSFLKDNEKNLKKWFKKFDSFSWSH